MEKITTVDQLKQKIVELELTCANQKVLLKEEVAITYEKLKPINLIKHKINDLISNADFKSDVLNAGLGLAAGFLTKKAAIGSTHNPIKQLIGTLLQVGVSSLVSKNGESINTTIMNLLSNLINKNKG